MKALLVPSFCNLSLVCGGINGRQKGSVPCTDCYLLKRHICFLLASRRPIQSYLIQSTSLLPRPHGSGFENKVEVG